MKIPVVVVDDEQVDRYTVKRRLGKRPEFGTILECCSGDAFLADHCDRNWPFNPVDLPAIILTDINMPGRDGLETISEFSERQEQGRAPVAVVICMITSSANPRDRDRARNLGLVQGYIEKPLDAPGVERLLELYFASVDIAAGEDC